MIEYLSINSLGVIGDATVDLMVFYKKEVSTNPRHHESDLVDRLLANRQVISSYRSSIEKERIAA